MDSQPTDKVEGVGDDFVRGGQDETPIKPKRKRIVVTALSEAHAEVLCNRRQRYTHASVLERPPKRYGHQLKLAEKINLPLCR